MWIFCSGLQRSGSTVQYQITSEIVERCGKGIRVPHPMGRDFSEIKQKYYSNEWKVFKTHHLTDSIHKEFMEHAAKGVCIYRDIRDVCVSMMNKFNYSFDDLTKQNFIDSYLKEYEQWKSLPNMYMSKYENIFSDLSLEVKQIAAHLGTEISDLQIADISKELAIEKQKKRIWWPKLKAILLGRKSWDKKSQLHWNHINTGEVGQWKDKLKAEDLNYIYEKCGAWMTSLGYEK